MGLPDKKIEEKTLKIILKIELFYKTIFNEDFLEQDLNKIKQTTKEVLKNTEHGKVLKRVPF